MAVRIKVRVDSRGSEAKFTFLKRFIPGAAKRLIEEGSLIFFQEMHMAVPTVRGTLRNSIRREVQGLRAEVKTTSGYGKPVDQGSRPHTIRPVRAKALRIPHIGFRKKVEHPGSKGRFFVRRTITKARPRIRQLVATIKRELKRGQGAV